MIPLFKVAMDPSAHVYVEEVLSSGYIGQGERVERFEDMLEQSLNLQMRPLAVSSGTAALDLAAHLVGIGVGDEVISTPMTCTATNGVLANRGARIVWADVNPHTGLISPEDCARKMTKQTKAIMAVDWGGALCDYVALRKLGVPIIQDSAHCFSPVDERNHGDYICWSFQAIKFLTTGDGGALVCPTEEETERARLLRWFGLDRRSKADFRCSQDIKEIGYKYHMNDISAAIGIANIDQARRNVTIHREHTWLMSEQFGTSPGLNSSCWLFTILVDNRDEVIRKLKNVQIESSPVHARNDKHTAFKKFFNGDLPGVDQFSSSNLAIPVGWWLDLYKLHYIVDQVKKIAIGY